MRSLGVRIGDYGGFAGVLLTLVGLEAGFSSPAHAQGAGWTGTKKIVMNTSATGANVTADVAKFPVPVRLNAANFDFAQAKSDGSDLRFTDAAGAKLPYEIEYWDAAGKTGMVWVKADVKGNNATQHINLHWGNPSAASESDSKIVFAKEDGWVGVWHMSEAGNTTAGGYKDATANEAHGTGTNFPASATTQCVTGRCPEFDNPSKRSINIGGEKKKLFDITQKLTFSIWVKAKSYAEAYVTMFAKGDKSWRVQMFGIYTWGSHNGKYLTEMCLQTGSGDGACLEHHNDEAKPGEWRLLTVVHDFPNMRYYIDMNMVQTSNSGVWRSEDYDVGIGWQSQYKGRWYTGNLDEARVNNLPKDVNWVKLNFESQKPTSKFLEFGAGSTSIAPKGRGEKSAVLESSAQGTVPSGIYDLHGRRIGEVRPGIHLERHVNGDGTLITRKRAILP